MAVSRTDMERLQRDREQAKEAVIRAERDEEAAKKDAVRRKEHLQEKFGRTPQKAEERVKELKSEIDTRYTAAKTNLKELRDLRDA